MSDKTGENRLAELNKEVLRSVGFQVVNRLFKFDQSLKIFLCNFADFENAVRETMTANLHLDIRDTQRRIQLDTAMFEVLRHLHNTVAAALSLIDHTRNFYNEFYHADNLIPEFQAQVASRFAKDGLSQFVKGLRQYCQHYRVPSVSTIIFLDNKDGSYTQSVNTPKADLLEFSNWSSFAKSYIEGMPDNVNLLSVMQSYRDHVLSFHHWFHAQLVTLHKKDISHYNLIIYEINSILSLNPLYRDYRPPSPPVQPK